MADLAGIRKLFVEATGRYELVDDAAGGDYTNNTDNIGADFFIHAGLRYLDSKQDTRKSDNVFTKKFEVGSYKQLLLGIRNIQKVYFTPNGKGRSEVYRMALSQMKEEYPDAPGDTSNGTPTHYTLTVDTQSPEIAQEYADAATYEAARALGTADFLYEWEDILFGTDRFKKETILVMPPAKEEGTLTVYGQFLSIMTEDTDISYWSDVYPEVLVWAAQLALEAFYRNTEGFLDWMRTIDTWLKGIDHDLVREEMNAAGNQREG